MLIMSCDELWCYDDACHGYLEVDDERRTQHSIVVRYAEPEAYDKVGEERQKAEQCDLATFNE